MLHPSPRTVPLSGRPGVSTRGAIQPEGWEKSETLVTLIGLPLLVEKIPCGSSHHSVLERQRASRSKTSGATKTARS